MVTGDIDRLLARYFAGELSPQDETRLDKWLGESDENEKYFFELTSLYQNLSGTTAPDFEAQEAFDAFRDYIRTGFEKKSFLSIEKNKTFIWLLGVAAAMIGVFLIFNRGGDYVVISEKGVHTLADNIEVDIREGEVRLAESDTIYLQGAAEFVLDSEKSGSQIVKVGDVYIKDIGTRFSVDADIPDSIHVSVMEGEVLFFSNDDLGINLKINESGYYLARDKRFYKIVLRGNFGFEGVALGAVVSQLVKFYGQPITLKDEEVKGLLINVTFQEEDLATILDVISTTLNLEIEYENSEYVVAQRRS